MQILARFFGCKSSISEGNSRGICPWSAIGSDRKWSRGRPIAHLTTILHSRGRLRARLGAFGFLGQPGPRQMLLRNRHEKYPANGS